MAGSGKFVKIQAGHLSVGTDSTTWADSVTTTLSRRGHTYYGIAINTLTHLQLQNVSELSICGYRGYTGIINVCTGYNNTTKFSSLGTYEEVTIDGNTYEMVSFDVMAAGTLSTTFKRLRFVNGLMVGEVT